MIADIFTDISASAYLTGYEQYLGAENLNLNTAANRMVWVPSNDAFDGGQGRRSTAVGGKVSKRTRFGGVKIRIFVKSSVANTAVAEIRAMEQAINKLVIAIHESTWGSYDIQSGTWVQQDGQELLQYGRAYDLECAWILPVYKDDAAVLTTDNQTTAILSSPSPHTSSTTDILPAWTNL